jgi:hypothetical protein
MDPIRRARSMAATVAVIATAFLITAVAACAVPDTPGTLCATRGSPVYTILKDADGEPVRWILL